MYISRKEVNELLECLDHAQHELGNIDRVVDDMEYEGLPVNNILLSASRSISDAEDILHNKVS